MKLDINAMGDLRLILESPEEAVSLGISKDRAEIINGRSIGIVYLSKAPMQCWR